jgi:hypothetical protein
MLLPPHFISDLPNVEELNEVVPNYQWYPTLFKTAITMLVASVVYHHDYLMTVLDTNHPYRKSRLAEEYADAWKHRVVAGKSKCSHTGNNK